MPLDPMIARGVQPIDVSNTLLNIAQIQYQQMLMDRQQQSDAAAQHADELKQSLARTQWLLAQPSVTETLRSNPQNAQQMYQGLGLPPDAPEDVVRQRLQQHMIDASSQLGIGPPAAEDTRPKMGTVNPGDYTPASLAKFQQTGNPADLVRYQAPQQGAQGSWSAPFQAIGPDGKPGLYTQHSITGQTRPAGNGLAPIPRETSADPNAVKKVSNARDVLDIVAQAEPLIEQSTGSYLGYGVDQTARAFGASTEGARANAKLRALQASLMLKQPRMEGPQSNLDVQLYREAAGQIGDPTVPAETKKAALETIKGLNTKYAEGQQQGPLSPGTGAKRTVKFGDL